MSAWGIISDKFELRVLAGTVIPDVSGYRRLALCRRNRCALIPPCSSSGRMYGALVMRMMKHVGESHTRCAWDVIARGGGVRRQTRLFFAQESKASRMIQKGLPSSLGWGNMKLSGLTFL